MRKTFLYLLLFFLTTAVVSTELKAQEQINLPLRFKKLGIDDGLPQSHITSILQDQKGFLWLGTEDGLSVYDGYEFKNYTHVADDSSSLSSSSITSLYQDQEGVLWIGTTNGVNKYDSKYDRFVQYQAADRNSNLNTRTVRSIHQDTYGVLWVGTESGIRIYDKLNNTINFSQEYRGLYEVPILSMIEDKDSTLWVGTESGLYQLNRRRKVFEPAFFGAKKITQFPVYSFLEDSKGQLWVGTQNGLHRLNAQRTEIKNFQALDGSDISLSNNIIKSIEEDSRGTIWIGTYGGGINRYIPKEERVVSVRQNDADPYTLSDDIVEVILQDRSGIIWLGTSDGLNKYDEDKEVFYNYPVPLQKVARTLQKEVWALLQDHEGNFWIGTADGLYLYAIKPESTQWELKRVDEKMGIADKHVLSLLEDKQRNLWIGTSQNGLYKCSLRADSLYAKARPVVLSKQNTSLGNYSVWTMLEDTYGDIWVGTNNGLFSVNKQTNRVLKYTESDGSGLSDNSIWALEQDRYGIIWVGTSNGLNRFRKQSKDFISYYEASQTERGLSNNYVVTIFEDTMGTLWIGTHGGGLNRFHKEADNFTHYSEKDGLPDGVIYAIEQDKNKHLWLSTNRGLSRFNTDTQAFRNYDMNDGLPSNRFNHHASMYTENGELVFGTSNGITLFHPDSIKDNRYIPPVYLTNLKVLGRDIKVNDETGILTRNLQQTELITLSAEQNSISIDFTALNYRLPKKTLYAYKLEGLETESDWQYTNYRNHTASYTNLPEGREYIFRVRAANNDGYWNESGATLRIYIKPPFWEVVWFRIGLAMFVIGIFVAVWLWRNSEMQKQRNKLSMQVQMRTNELETEKEKLQLAYDEISNQSRQILEMNAILKQKQTEVMAQRDSLSEQRNEIQDSYKNISTLSEIGQEVTATLDFNQMVGILYRRVNELMDAPGFGIGTLNEKRKLIEFRGYSVEGKQLEYDFNAVTDKNLLSAWAIRHKKAVRIGDLKSEYVNYIAGEFKAIGNTVLPTSLVYLPLTIKNRTLGVLTVQTKEKDAYTDNHLTLLKGLASYVSIALDNIQNYTEIEEANTIIESNNVRIMDSLRYAQTIQHAILPSTDSLQEYVEESFVLFKPKDVVSGDFYWLREIEGRVFLAVVDCTGHGVPGAFMSMIGSRLLNEIINEANILEPAKILDELHARLRKALRQQEGKNDDGMDIALCRIDALEEDTLEREIVFAGAKRHAVWVSRGEMHIIKGDKKSIGGWKKRNTRPYIQLQMTAKKGDALYMYSDGFTDQHNVAGVKYSSKRLQEFFQRHAEYEMTEQRTLLEDELVRHQGNQKQRDDITVVGIRL